MLKKKISAILLASILPLSAQAGWGLSDLKDNLISDCDNAKDKAKCNREAAAGAAVKIGKVVIAAKVFYDLVIDFTSKQVKSEKEVNKEYLKTNKVLPKKTKITSYKTNIAPGKVIPLGKPASAHSKITIVAGTSNPTNLIQEKIIFFDNDDPTKELRSLVKDVNKKNKKTGAFENTFTFTLPEGMAQGVYKIKTSLIINGTESKPLNNEMQVVLNVFEDRSYQFASVAY